MSRYKELIVGSGAREHAMGEKLIKSSQVAEVFFAPGNAGTALIGKNLPVEATDIAGIQTVVSQHEIDTVVVGPEAPLALGITDALTEQGVDVFGPTQDAARLESSKIFSQRFMDKYNIPHPPGYIPRDFRDAVEFVEHSRWQSLVIKADGLTAGKGVILPESKQEARYALSDMMQFGKFGEAGEKVLLQKRVSGPEISYITFVSGKQVVPMLAVADYKRLREGDKGPNTGGMGAIGPVYLREDMEQDILETIVQPTVDAMDAEGTPLKGFLYTQLMLTETGMQVLEYNVRGGDPETQLQMNLLVTDFSKIVRHVIQGTLRPGEAHWRNKNAVCVTLAAEGYPKNPVKGSEIHGLDTLKNEGGVSVYHAGTTADGEKILSDGGRVLSIVGVGHSIGNARRLVYEQIGEQGVWFDGMQYRKDIGGY